MGPFTNYIHELGVLKAYKKNLPNAISVLNEHNITDINKKDENGSPPLHLAAENGHTDVVKALIAAGADVNVRNLSEDTPLHKAVRSTWITKVLLTAGVDLNARNFVGQTPLNNAKRYGRIGVAQELLTAGAVDENRESPSICMVALVNWCRNEGLISLCKLSLFTLALFVYALYLKIYGVPRKLNDGL